MKRHFAIFGRQPEISLAEFLAVRPNLPPPLLVGNGAIFDDPTWDGGALNALLGGTVKLGDIVFEGKTDEINESLLADLILAHPREPRIIFGMSVVVGEGVGRKRIEMLPLKVKRELKQRGFASRWVTGDGTIEPTPAAVAKLHLTTEGYDLVVFCSRENAFVGLTTHVQDADAWSLRDYGRPGRDDKSGMLPPKLARIMVNLAQIKDGEILIDPFCGSGTIQMEAALATRAKKIIGSDISPKCVTDTEANLDWLVAQHILSDADRIRTQTILCDARILDSLGVHRGNDIKEPIDAVVTEGFLGPPLSGREPKTVLEKNAKEITALWRETLKTLRPLLSKRGRIIGIWPEFGEGRDRVAVDLTADLSSLGYSLVGHPLRYQRPNQRVTRRIVHLSAT